MKEKAVLGITLMLLLVSMLILTFNVQPVKSSYTWTETIYIRADGSFEPLNAPIHTDDNITYTLIDNIVGDVPENTSAIVVERDNIVINGADFIIQGNKTCESKGIDLSGRTNVTVKNIQIKNFCYGVYLNFSNYNNIYVNTIIENDYGIWFYFSNCNVIVENNITASSYVGINLLGSLNNSITRTTVMTSNFGIVVSNFSNYNSIIENNVTANHDGVSIIYSSSNAINRNTITNNDDDGIVLYSSNYTTIDENDVRANKVYGICIYDSSINNVSRNTITNNKHGAFLTFSNYTYIVENTIINNDCGIYFSNASSSKIIENIIVNNNDGVLLGFSDHIDISRNNITANKDCGVYLLGSSNSNIEENTIVNNDLGIYLVCSSNNNINGNIIRSSSYCGICLWDSSDNKIYHNNFIDNVQQVYFLWSDYANVWDDGYPSGGNYWSDYMGIDAYDIGIGNTPYVINANNQDRYPLLKPWPPEEHDLVVLIKVPLDFQLGSSVWINAKVVNRGLNDETDVEFLLIINGTTTNSTIIPLLKPRESCTISYLWTPTASGTYNVTAYATSVFGEVVIENDQETEFVTVSPPPEKGVKPSYWILIVVIGVVLAVFLTCKRKHEKPEMASIQTINCQNESFILLAGKKFIDSAGKILPKKALDMKGHVKKDLTFRMLQAVGEKFTELDKKEAKSWLEKAAGSKDIPKVQKSKESMMISILLGLIMIIIGLVGIYTNFEGAILIAAILSGLSFLLMQHEENIRLLSAADIGDNVILSFFSMKDISRRTSPFYRVWVIIPKSLDGAARAKGIFKAVRDKVGVEPLTEWEWFESKSIREMFIGSKLKGVKENIWQSL